MGMGRNGAIPEPVIKVSTCALLLFFVCYCAGDLTFVTKLRELLHFECACPFSQEAERPGQSRAIRGDSEGHMLEVDVCDRSRGHLLPGRDGHERLVQTNERYLVEMVVVGVGQLGPCSE